MSMEIKLQLCLDPSGHPQPQRPPRCNLLDVDDSTMHNKQNPCSPPRPRSGIKPNQFCKFWLLHTSAHTPPVRYKGMLCFGDGLSTSWMDLVQRLLSQRSPPPYVVKGTGCKHTHPLVASVQ
jgi:hypothetical protein